MNPVTSAWRYLWGKKWLLAIIVVGVIGIGWYVAAKSQKPTHQFVTVRKGAITETVSVTGNTTSTQNVSLGFETGGTIAQVYVKIGDRVQSGQTLVALNSADLRAQLAQAQANVEVAQAGLDKLLVGPRDQNVAVSATALTTAQQSLTNAYTGVPNTFADSYAKANDATRNQLNAFFSNGETNNPQLIISIKDSQTINNAQTARLQAGALLNAWQTELAQASGTVSQAMLDQALQDAAARLATLKQFMGIITVALTELTTPSAPSVVTYQTSLTAASNEINAAATNISTLIQNIAAQKAAVAQAQAQLSLTLATSTLQDVESQRAQVSQAQANVASVEAKLQKTALISPIYGVVTTQNAKAGQIASPGIPLVTIISSGGFNIDAQIPEVDIGKVQVGDQVSMTLDAFPGETFAGTVFYINPGETINQGVVDYDVKISFAKSDPRVKSGLTANLNIETKTETSTLILPQFAVLQTATGTSVEVLENGSAVTKPVTLGIRDQQGNVQILSGVTEGEQVINIGLK
jgi:HlyD family secretion protein